MKTFSRYLFLTLTAVLMMTMSSCDDKEEVEFNLPGTWYTDQEIDYGAYTWGVGTVMSFNESHDGYIGAAGDSQHYLYFTWYWLNGYKYETTMVLQFRDGTTAYIEGAQASYRRFSGTWFNSLMDFEDGYNGTYFSMHRVD